MLYNKQHLQEYQSHERQRNIEETIPDQRGSRKQETMHRCVTSPRLDLGPDEGHLVEQLTTYEKDLQIKCSFTGFDHCSLVIW